MSINDHGRDDSQPNALGGAIAALVQRAPFGILIVDAALRILLVNPAARQGAFRNENPVEGMSLVEAVQVLWDEQVAAAGVLQEFRKTLETGTSFHSRDFVHARADIDRVEAYEWELHRIELDDGASAIACYFYDLTEHRTRAEAALRRNAESFFSLIENSPFGVYVVDADFRIVQASQQAHKTFSPVEQLIGTDLGDAQRAIWPEPFASKTIGYHRRALETGEPYSSDDTVEARVDKDLVEAYDWRVERIVLPDGRFGVVCQFYDQTKREQLAEMLRESEARFRNMADHSPVMVWVTEADGACTYLSKSWYEFTGQTPETGLGFGWISALHPDDREGVKSAFLNANARGEGFRLEYRLRRADGVYRWAIDAAVPRAVVDGTALGYIGSVIDISERREAEESLRDADRRKDEFLALLAHELRNPLAAIRNAGRLLLRTDTDINTHRAAANILNRQAEHMVRQVDDLLDVSRISREMIELRMERVDLAELLDQAVEANQPDCAAAGIELTITRPANPLCVQGDPTRLAQVVGNLLNNACKFTYKGGRIWLSVEREGAEAVIRVRDTGIGIAAADLERIFDMFAQADRARERTSSGLGLGLSLVKSLVELHGGTVKASSPGAGQGAEFIVRLRSIASEPFQRGSDVAPSESVEPSRRRILVVDDNRDAAESLAILLQSMGNEVETAHDGREAISKTTSFQPDVILLDIGMPGMNGYETARHLREQGGNRATLVALTGWSQDEDRRRSKEAGFDAHLVKPVDIAILAKLIADRSVDGDST